MQCVGWHAWYAKNGSFLVDIVHYDMSVKSNMLMTINFLFVQDILCFGGLRNNINFNYVVNI